MSTERERVISVTLSEAEWQAFIARQPQPVSWLRERIRDEVVGGKLGDRQSGTKNHESRKES
jgi:hypothetical protein